MWIVMPEIDAAQHVWQTPSKEGLMSTMTTLTRSLSTLTMAGALVVGVAAVKPGEVYGGSCFPLTHNRSVTGNSTVDCPWALMDFDHKANAIAEDHCSTIGQAVCFQTDSNPQFCTTLQPPFTVHGTVSFRCTGIPQQGF